MKRFWWECKKSNKQYLLIRVGSCGTYSTVRPTKETNYHRGKLNLTCQSQKKPQSTAAGWGKHQASGHTENCTACLLWMCFSFHQGPTLCATIRVCLTALETQQITSSTLLNPTRWLAGKSVNPSLGTALGRATVQPPTHTGGSTQFTPDCFRFWPAGSCKPLGTEITIQCFWAACFTVFMVTVAKAHSRSEQNWGMNDLHSSLGIVLNNLLGFCPLGGTKPHLLC